MPGKTGGTRAVVEGPAPARLARARCLVPVLGHVTVRLASMSPTLQAVSEMHSAGSGGIEAQCTRRWEEGGEAQSEEQEILSGPEQEVQTAIDDVISKAQSMVRFTTELAELCAAEGQWLAVLALAPKVVRKFTNDFSLLAGSLDTVMWRMAERKVQDWPCSSSESSHVTTQPGAASGAERLEATAAGVAGAITTATLAVAGGYGQAAVLHAMLATMSSDLRADAEGDALCNKLGGLELEVAHELQSLLLPHAAGGNDDADVVARGDGLPGSSKGEEANEDFEHDQNETKSKERKQVLMQKLSELGGAQRPLAALAREFEAAEQFCCLYRLPHSTRGADSRPPGGGKEGGRDALVSEAQASGGSALHRWIRAQVAEPQGRRLGLGEAQPVGGAGGAKGATGQPAFVKLSDIPHEFLCPIAQDVMRDAVSTCDGHTYERRNIEAWLAEKSTSPITGLPLANKALIPNHNLRKLILDSGVLSRLEPDAKPTTEGTRFRDDIFCEIVVPRDVATLAEALCMGAARVSLAVNQSAASTGSSGERRSIVSNPRTPPGGRTPTFGVRLLAGEHLVHQTLQVDQGVEIVGGGTSLTVLRLKGDANIEVRSTMRLANIAVCRDMAPAGAGAAAAVAAGCARFARAACSGGARSPALLEIMQGSCRIEQCDLSNPVGSGIRVSGAHTSPMITKSTIHGCRDTGVVFKDGADGALSGNRLFGNLSVAIEVHSRADPLIEDNDVFDGRQGGVFVYNRGKGHLRRNKIFRNALEGVEIKQGGRPLVEDNDIYDNLECGIFIHEGGEGRIIGNRIHSNSYAGIEIKDASSPEVRGNDVYSGRTSGMYVHSGGQGMIEGNKIHQNWLHGVYVRSKGCPHLVKNTVFKNDECGIFITESSHPCVEHNEVHSNGLAGIEVKEESNPTIKLNRIHDGNTGGIFVLARGKGRIFENKLYNNKLEGVEIKDGGDPHIFDNEIYENCECGIFAHDGALGRIEDNRIFANLYAGVEIKDMSSPVVKNNRIYRGQTSGVYVHSGGQGKVIENDIFENGLHGIMILSGGNPCMDRNKVHDNVECGVVSHVSYALDTTGNHIYSNRIKNVQTVKF